MSAFQVHVVVTPCCATRLVVLVCSQLTGGRKKKYARRPPGGQPVGLKSRDEERALHIKLQAWLGEGKLASGRGLSS